MPYVKQITIRTTLNRSLRYIVNDNKTDYGCLVTGVNCATNDKLAYKQMLENKKKHNKEKGTLGFHFIQSFKENEVTDPYKVHEIGLKWAEKLFGDKYQFIISTHLDKGHYHNHIIINSVGLDGKKFNACKQSLKDARDFSDEVAREYKLNVIPFNKNSVPKSYKEWNEEKRGNSWKVHIKNEIDIVIQSSSSFEDFMNKMNQRGYTMKQGSVKYMTFRAPGMERSVRGKTLGVEYTEERIKERIRLKEFNITESKRGFKYRFKRNPGHMRIYDAARRFQYRRGTLAVNLILTLALLKTLSDRSSPVGGTNNRSSKKNYSIDIEISKISNQLKFITAHDLKSRDDVAKRIEIEKKQAKEINAVISEASDMNEKMRIILQTIDVYRKHKPIFDEFNSSTLKKVFLKKKYNMELETFDKADKFLKKLEIKENEFEIYAAKHKAYGEKIEQLEKKLEASKDIIQKLEMINETLEHKRSLSLLNSGGSLERENKRDR